MSHTDGGGRSTKSARASGGDMQGAATRPKKGSPPPLAWLIIGLLLLLGAIAFFTMDGSRQPANPGPSMPVDNQDTGGLVDPATVPPPARTTGESGGPAAPVTPVEPRPVTPVQAQ